MPARALTQRVPKQLGVHVGVTVDETGCDHVPFGIDLSPPPLVDATDAGDPVTRDPDVPPVPRSSGPVDDGAISDDQIIRQ